MLLMGIHPLFRVGHSFDRGTHMYFLRVNVCIFCNADGLHAHVHTVLLRTSGQIFRASL